MGGIPKVVGKGIVISYPVDTLGLEVDWIWGRGY
jgi:hypothetical protein